MKILVIGSGGREHALAWKLKGSPLVKKIYCAPGNPGMENVATCLDIQATDIDGLLKFAKEKKIDLTVVGPEAPLVAGIADRFEKERLKIFGPTQKASQLEGSKVFAKEFMQRCNIPTASFKAFDNLEKARSFAKKADYPLVIKADGLASGKGVVICQTIEEARKNLDSIMGDKIFKEAGNKVVIEECLQGEEVSILAISDGDDFVVLESAQDHKRIFDDDLGPNTGGMGAYSPTPMINEEMAKKIESRIFDPAIRGMRREGMPFRGVLYAGLMLTAEGPMVLEFNVRFGDPETQALLPRLKNDLVDVLMASCEGRMNHIQLSWERRASVCVVMSSGGYPGKYKTGIEIKGLDNVGTELDTYVFHAGTKREGNKILTVGGRVLSVTALGDSLDAAIKRTYSIVEKIKFDHCFFRRDIGAKAMIWTDKKSHTATHR